MMGDGNIQVAATATGASHSKGGIIIYSKYEMLISHILNCSIS